jgi:hypothetical protein
MNVTGMRSRLSTRRACVQQVPHPRALRMQIGEVLPGGARRQRDALDQLEPEAVEATHLSRVVREQADAAHAEIEHELCADSVFACIHRQAQFEVRFNGVAARLATSPITNARCSIPSVSDCHA